MTFGSEPRKRHFDKAKHDNGDARPQYIAKRQRIDARQTRQFAKAGEFIVTVKNLNPRLDTAAFEDVVLPLSDGIRFAYVFCQHKTSVYKNARIVFANREWAIRFFEEFQGVRLDGREMHLSKPEAAEQKWANLNSNAVSRTRLAPANPPRTHPVMPTRRTRRSPSPTSYRSDPPRFSRSPTRSSTPYAARSSHRSPPRTSQKSPPRAARGISPRSSSHRFRSSSMSGRSSTRGGPASSRLYQNSSPERYPAKTKARSAESLKPRQGMPSGRRPSSLVAQLPMSSRFRREKSPPAYAHGKASLVRMYEARPNEILPPSRRRLSSKTEVLRQQALQSLRR